MDYSELTIKISRGSGEPGGGLEEIYLISEPPFETFDAGAIWEELSELLRHSREMDWVGGYTIDEHRRIDEGPGASGWWWELVLNASYTIPTGVVAYGAKVTFNRLADRLGVREVPALERDEAIGKAQWSLLISTPSLEHSSLGDPVSEEYDFENKRWTFKFRPNNGYDYTVVIGWHKKVPGVVRVLREKIDQ